MDRTKVTDVLILGAGPVGLALAGLLRGCGYSCVVAGPAGSGGPERMDPRALAITPAVRAILEQCGAWQQLAPGSVGNFQRMEVWDAGGAGRIEFDSADLCMSTLGHIVNQSRLEQALLSALTGSGVEQVNTGEPDSITWYPEYAEVSFAGGVRRRAKLLVGADGARSRVRELAGIDFAARPYEQHALACEVRTGKPHGCVARQRFLHDGPMAFLPLADEYSCGVVWTTTPDQARRLQQLDAAVFSAELADAFEHKTGPVQVIGPRQVFPLQRAQAERYCRPRLALVGDAAHCVHPLAGQGANLGMLDAASLAQVLQVARQAGRDPGAMRVLRDYERWRRGENGLMIAALDALQKIFAADGMAARRLRNAGLVLCDALDPVKRRFMLRAMGLVGDLPVAARVSLLTTQFL